MDIVQSVLGGVLAEAEAELVLEADPVSEWRLLGLVARETVSQPYEHVLDAVTDNPLPDLGAFPGTRVHVLLARSLLATRRFTGIVQRAEDIEQMRDGRWRIRIVLVPELWLLGLRQDCRIFPNANVVAIVREVLDAASLYPGERLQWRLSDDRAQVHPTREHCVQYRETDLAFLSRILEDEGLTYYFAHDESPLETLVIADGGLAMREGVYPLVPTELPGVPVRVTAPSEAPFLAHQSVFGFGQERQITPRSVVLRDFDFTHFRSRSATQSSARAPAGAGGPLLEIYDGAHRFRQRALAGDAGAGAPGPSGTMADIASGGRGGLLGGGLTRLVQGGIDASLPMPMAPAPPVSAGHDATRVAELRLQERQVPGNQFAARSNVLGIAAGHQIAIDEPVRNERDGAYVVLECEHRWHRPDAEHEGTTGQHRAPQYENTFRCIPRDVPHRPSRVTPRPFVAGTQTATVVGAPGEEMHVDAYGRVRVQFHWDRRHDATANRDAEPGSAGSDIARNVSRLCWVRCAQSWAGSGWGSMFIPRVGMEVVVTFLEGDPDRPLIVGCVHNDACPPAYELPRNCHRTSIRTRSTPADQKTGGREGYNELRFDDHSNHEEVFLHAEKDLREVVRDHHETWIGGAQDLEVRMHQTNKVGGSREKAIAGNETNTIGGHRSTAVSRTRSTVVHGLDSLTANAGRVHTVSGFESRTIGGPHLHHIRAGGGGGPDPDAERFGQQAAAASSGGGGSSGGGARPASGGGGGGGSSAAPGTADPSWRDRGSEHGTTMISRGHRPPSNEPGGAGSSTTSSTGGDSGSSGGAGAGSDGSPGGASGGSTAPSGGAGGASSPGASGGSSTGGESGEGAETEPEEGPLETYIVEGDREVRIDGSEHIRVKQSRFVEVRYGDEVEATSIDYHCEGPLYFTSSLPVAQGLSAEEEVTKVFRANDRLEIRDSTLWLTRSHNAQQLFMSGRGVVLSSRTGAAIISQGPQSAPGTLKIDQDGVRIELTTSYGARVELRDASIMVQAGANGTIQIGNAARTGGLVISPDGQVNINGTRIEINGVAIT